MFQTTRSRRRQESLKLQLLAERPGMAGPELALGDIAGVLEFLRSDWVSTWLDPRNRYVAPEEGLTATRAINSEGRLLWLVKHPRKRRVYHARAASAERAIDEAKTAWLRRREMRMHKDEVRRIVRDLRFLRARYDVTVDDAYVSPLCEEGVDGFLRSLGLARYRRFPGWLIAWLYALDRQVGYVLYEAHRRHMGGSLPPEASNRMLGPGQTGPIRKAG